MRRLAAVALACSALAACRGRGVVGAGGAPRDAGALDAGQRDASDAASEAVADAAGDAGEDAGDVDGPDLQDAETFEALPVAVRSYVVTATLTVTPPPGDRGAWTSFPATQTFTFVWWPSRCRFVASAGGALASGAVTTTDERTFHAAGSFPISLPFATSCDSIATIEYDELTFGIDGTLLGAGRGTARYQTGDEVLSAPVTATFTSVVDAVPPGFVLPTGLVDPLAPLAVPISEPVSAIGTAGLVGTTSVVPVTLAPADVDPTDLAIGGLTKANVALRYGETYEIVTDHFSDFGGNVPRAHTATLTTSPLPPLAEQDGFESVTGTMFAGAGVLRGGPLTPIAGTTSLLLNTGFGGGFGFLPYDLGSSLSVRLAVAPGATVVRFEAQLIAPDPVDAAAFVGALRVGSVGLPVSSSMNVAGTSFARVTLPGNGDVFISPVQTVSLPLPEVVSDEVVFEIVGVTFACGLPPSPTVLVVDNLRVE
jgi:hypothetical protein